MAAGNRGRGGGAGRAGGRPGGGRARGSGPTLPGAGGQAGRGAGRRERGLSRLGTAGAGRGHARADSAGERRMSAEGHFVRRPLGDAEYAEIGALTARIGCGAVNAFYGVARPDDVGGRRVAALEYEAYEAMADRALRDLLEA